MRKFVEYLLIILIAYSIIEFTSIVLATLLHSYANVTNTEALTTSKTLILELFICVLAAFIYNNRSVKKK